MYFPSLGDSKGTCQEILTFADSIQAWDEVIVAHDSKP